MHQASLLRDEAMIVPIAPRAQAWSNEPLLTCKQWLRAGVYTPRSPRGSGSKPPRPYSDSTQRTYLSLFARYLAHLRGHDVTLSRAAPVHVDAFLKTLTGRQDGLASHEIKRRALVLLERIYAEPIRVRLARENPTKPLFRVYALPPASRAETTVLGAEQLAALREHISALPADTLAQARRAAMPAVMLSCGITGEDLRHIEAAAAGRDGGLCINMPRTAARDSGRPHLGAFAAPILERYLQRRQEAGANGPLLFAATTEGSTPISHQTLHRYVIRALEASGVRDRVGTQRILRATLAVQLLQPNVSREDVRKTLRLHQLDQVERYERFKRVLPPF
jgi:hypothetical protein